MYLDGEPRAVPHRYTNLFNSCDRVTAGTPGDNDYYCGYRITAQELRRRLDMIGATLPASVASFRAVVDAAAKDALDIDVIRYASFFVYAKALSDDELVMSPRPDQALASGALAMAIAHRNPKHGTIHHSDQGTQYTSKAYQQQLQSAGFVVSMSRKGMPYDNAVMESFFSSLKLELTHHESFADLDAARTKIFHYIEVFYNRQRLHSSLDYHSPDTFERVHRAP
jgi:putative transposase